LLGVRYILESRRVSEHYTAATAVAIGNVVTFAAKQFGAAAFNPIHPSWVVRAGIGIGIRVGIGALACRLLGIKSIAVAIIVTHVSNAAGIIAASTTVDDCTVRPVG
jgi:hypothetical protein